MKSKLKTFFIHKKLAESAKEKNRSILRSKGNIKVILKPNPLDSGPAKIRDLLQNVSGIA